ncbi:hypothetical protein CGLO_14169 [Colletotrichum gloeosporioides Cg-14]|uniref:Uncharacterized protein n=1 Tax=Colletotrichum gloeosporioides (strain Cg-14) TaxID=1237896 RepID=T0JUV2_COLGC|nr:hypothetical protein CGLO_14169 [Colletotrichum gloeosporioides Cg-14]
MLHNQILV